MNLLGLNAAEQTYAHTNEAPLPSTFDVVSPRYVQVESSWPRIQGLKEPWLADESKAAH